jgi:hypothetical protein
MRKNISLSIVLFWVTISGFAQVEKTEEMILNLSKKKFDWMAARRYDSLEAILDDRLNYIHSNGWTQSKREVMDDFASGKLTYREIKVAESFVRLYDKTAIVTGKGKFSGFVSGNPFAMELAYTEVYIKRKKAWLLASRHANKMP